VSIHNRNRNDGEKYGSPYAIDKNIFAVFKVPANETNEKTEVDRLSDGLNHELFHQNNPDWTAGVALLFHIDVRWLWRIVFLQVCIYLFLFFH
jgi:hypothetical protein